MRVLGGGWVMVRSPLLGVLCSLWLVGLALAATLHPLTHLHEPDATQEFPVVCWECLALAADVYPALPLLWPSLAPAADSFNCAAYVHRPNSRVGKYQARAPPH